MIKNIFISIYHLHPLAVLNSRANQEETRQGFLLKIDFTDGLTGYADCHPWVEFGDMPLQSQLDSLSNDKHTELISRSVFFARQDAQLRAQKRNAFDDFNQNDLVKNHFVSAYEDLNEKSFVQLRKKKFQFIKVKFGKHLENEIAFIKKNYEILKSLDLKIRADFNGNFSFEQMCFFCNALKKESDVFDFLEDPCPFHAQHWQDLKRKYEIDLAIDAKPRDFFEFDFSSAFDVLVIKPAKEDPFSFSTKYLEKRIVLTSYMDHSFGQVAGLWQAIVFYRKYPEKREHCGFLTHRLFKENPYSNMLQTCDNLLVPSLEGSGFGFDDLLACEAWEKWK